MDLQELKSAYKCVAKLRAEMDLSPQTLPPLPTEPEAAECVTRTRKGGRFDRRLPFNGVELARMVEHRHQLMLREAAVDIATQFDLSDREQVDLIGHVKICRQGMVWFGLNFLAGNIAKGMAVEQVGAALQKALEGMDIVKGPTFRDAEID